MKKIAIIGAGNMGGAIAKGLAQGNIFEAKNILVSDLNEDNLRSIQNANNDIQVSTSNLAVIKEADYVVLAVKPWLVGVIINEIQSSLNLEKQVIVSVAAGVSCQDIADMIAQAGASVKPTLFRVIPNTAIAILESVSTIASYNATKEQDAFMVEVFNELGKSFLVPETQLNAYMALTSCGIAFAFRYIRASMVAGVEMGIYPEVAKELVTQTLRGAIDLIDTNNSNPEVEIDRVTTPGGITIKGLNEMEAYGFSNSVIKGAKASLIK